MKTARSDIEAELVLAGTPAWAARICALTGLHPARVESDAYRFGNVEVRVGSRASVAVDQFGDGYVSGSEAGFSVRLLPRLSGVVAFRPLRRSRGGGVVFVPTTSASAVGRAAAVVRNSNRRLVIQAAVVIERAGGR